MSHTTDDTAYDNLEQHQRRIRCLEKDMDRLQWLVLFGIVSMYVAIWWM